MAARFVKTEEHTEDSAHDGQSTSENSFGSVEDAMRQKTPPFWVPGIGFAGARRPASVLPLADFGCGVGTLDPLVEHHSHHDWSRIKPHGPQAKKDQPDYQRCEET